MQGETGRPQNPKAPPRSKKKVPRIITATHIPRKAGVPIGIERQPQPQEKYNPLSLALLLSFLLLLLLLVLLLILFLSFEYKRFSHG